MMGGHAGTNVMLPALTAMVAMLCPGHLLLPAVAEGQDDKVHHVEAKEKGVEKNAEIDHETWWPWPWGYKVEEVAPQDVTSDDTGKVTIISKTFKPPKAKKGKWTFKAFDGGDKTPQNVRDRLKSDINPGNYVDIVLDPDYLNWAETTISVLPDGEEAIKITVAKLTIPETAAEFPLKCEGNLQPPPGEGESQWHWSAKMGIKALVARYDISQNIEPIVGSTEALGYAVTEDNSLKKSEAIDYAPKHIVWYTLSHGRIVSGHFKGPVYGGGVLHPSDLPGELKYTLVFLCACGSAMPGDERFADAFGAKAYMGWKGVMHAAAAVQFSLCGFNSETQHAKRRFERLRASASAPRLPGGPFRPAASASARRPSGRE